MPAVKLLSLQEKYAAEDDVISSNIRELIAAMDITQTQFAELVGVTAPTVRKWISNPGRIRISDYRHICSLMEKRCVASSVGGAL